MKQSFFHSGALRSPILGARTSCITYSFTFLCYLAKYKHHILVLPPGNVLLVPTSVILARSPCFSKGPSWSFVISLSSFLCQARNVGPSCPSLHCACHPLLQVARTKVTLSQIVILPNSLVLYLIQNTLQQSNIIVFECFIASTGGYLLKCLQNTNRY